MGDRLDRCKGAQQITRLTHEVDCEHWHRMLFVHFLAENDLLIAPEYGVPASLEHCQELAREKGGLPGESSNRYGRATQECPTSAGTGTQARQCIEKHALTPGVH